MTDGLHGFRYGLHGFRYDPYGAGTEYEMSVPAWALKTCSECHAQHHIEGHAEDCPRLAEDA
jgi:cytochrome c553